MREEDTTHPPQDGRPRRSGPPEASAWERGHVRPGGCGGCSIAMSQKQRRWREPARVASQEGRKICPRQCGGGDEYGEHREVGDERPVF